MHRWQRGLCLQQPPRSAIRQKYSGTRPTLEHRQQAFPVAFNDAIDMPIALLNWFCVQNTNYDAINQITATTENEMQRQ